ncbi:MAG: C4-dicarboxylate ABC transporter, partial [Candidatus Entotheonellia bacterium]
MIENQQKKASASNHVSRRRWLGAAAAGAIAAGVGLTAAGNASAQAPTLTTLKMQSTWPTKDIFHEVFVDWGKKVEEMAGGRLKIDILPAGAVVPAFQLIEAVHQSTLD